MTHPKPPHRVSVNEAAAMLGVSRWTVRRMMDDGDLDGIRVRGALRVNVLSINRYIEANFVDGKLQDVVIAEAIVEETEPVEGEA